MPALGSIFCPTPSAFPDEAALIDLPIPKICLLTVRSHVTAKKKSLREADDESKGLKNPVLGVNVLHPAFGGAKFLQPLLKMVQI